MRALVLGANPVLVFNVVWALAAAGIEADVFSDWHAPRVRYSRHCRRYTRVPFHSLDEIRPDFINRIKKYCRRHEIDVVIPADLAAVFGLGRAGAGDLPCFPFASPQILETLHDKWRLYQLLSSHQLPSPGTWLLDAQRIAAAHELEYPVFVKPARGEGGRDIQRCDSEPDLQQLWQQIAAQPGPWLVQEMIPGEDIDLSLLADHGRIVAHTIQRQEGAQGMHFMRDDRMLGIAREIVRLTRFHGLAHFDMRIDSRDGEVCVIECNPRVWGSLMYSVWAGVNFIELGCRMALGQPVSGPGAHDEHVLHQGVAPRRLLKALLHGRTAPAGMTGATLASWRQAHADPLPQMLGGLTEYGENELRNALETRAASK